MKTVRFVRTLEEVLVVRLADGQSPEAFAALLNDTNRIPEQGYKFIIQSGPNEGDCTAVIEEADANQSLWEVED